MGEEFFTYGKLLAMDIFVIISEDPMEVSKLTLNFHKVNIYHYVLQDIVMSMGEVSNSSRCVSKFIENCSHTCSEKILYNISRTELYFKLLTNTNTRLSFLCLADVYNQVCNYVSPLDYRIQ